jgi:large subunit ribosomal protein L36
VRSGVRQKESRAVKVRKSLASLKSKPGAQVVRRRGVVFVVNKKNPRFKARQG